MKVPFDVGLTGVQRKKQENQQSNKVCEANILAMSVQCALFDR